MRDLRELKMNEGYRPITAGPLVVRPAPTDHQIDEFEQYFGVQLPPDYIAFLRFCNGGHPKLCSFVSKRGVRWDISFFYYLGGKEEPYGIWRAAVAWKNTGNVNSIPIATDGCGYKILLCFNNLPPSVELFIPGLEDDEEQDCRVARSFAGFLDMLYFDPESVSED